MRRRGSGDIRQPVFPTVVAVQAFIDQVADQGDECSRRLAGAALDVARAWDATGDRSLHELADYVMSALAGGPDIVDVIKARVKAKQLGFHDPFSVMPSLVGIDYRCLGQESRRH